MENIYIIRCPHCAAVRKMIHRTGSLPGKSRKCFRCGKSFTILSKRRSFNNIVSND